MIAKCQRRCRPTDINSENLLKVLLPSSYKAHLLTARSRLSLLWLPLTFSGWLFLGSQLSAAAIYAKRWLSINLPMTTGVIPPSSVQSTEPPKRFGTVFKEYSYYCMVFFRHALCQLEFTSYACGGAERLDWCDALTLTAALPQHGTYRVV